MYSVISPDQTNRPNKANHAFDTVKVANHTAAQSSIRCAMQTINNTPPRKKKNEHAPPDANTQHLLESRESFVVTLHICRGSKPSPQSTCISNKLIKKYNKNTKIREFAEHAQIEEQCWNPSVTPPTTDLPTTPVRLASTTHVQQSSSCQKIKNAHGITKLLPGLLACIYTNEGARGNVP